MSSNANTANSGLEAAAVATDKGAGGIGLSDHVGQQALNESLPSRPGDYLPNVAIGAMRSAQAAGISDQGAHNMLHNGFSIGEKLGGVGAKSADAIAIAGGMGARSFAEGKGASAIAEGAGASAVAEGRDAHAVAEGPGAHAKAEGPGTRAIAEDHDKVGRMSSDRPFKSDQAVQMGQPLEGGSVAMGVPGKSLPQRGTAEILPRAYQASEH